MKCLVLSFSNAKLHQYSKTDIGIKKFKAFHILDIDGKRTREEDEWMDVPVGTLSHKHVANVLRVLANERPIATFRTNLYSNSNLFEELAKNSFVDMNPVKYGGITTINSGEIQYITESSSAKKAVSDAWGKGSKQTIFINDELQTLETITPTWELIRVFLGESYDGFKNMVTLVLGSDALSLTFVNVLELLNKNKSNPLVIDFLTNLKNKSSLNSIILEGKVKGIGFHRSGFGDLSHWMVNTVSNTPIKVAKLKGKIYIPLTDDQVKLFENGPGVATILDGGLVCIDTLTDMSDSLIHDAVPTFIYERN